MAKTKISELDAAAANNTDINSVDVSEGCAPSGINNAIREMGAMLKRMDVGTDALTSPDINGGSIDGATIGTNSVITDLRVDNLRLDGNTISSTNTDGSITLDPNGTGRVNVVGELEADSLDIDGDGTIDGSLTITTADNNPQLVLKSTDADATEGPVLDLYRNSSSPADNDAIGAIKFNGEDDADAKRTYAEIQVTARDVTNDTIDSELQFFIRRNNNLREAVQLNENGVIFNDAGDDVDFRIESDGNTSMFFLNGGDNTVGIGTGSPTNPLTVRGTAGTGNSAAIRIRDESDQGATLGVFNSGNVGFNAEQGDIFFTFNTVGKFEFKNGGDLEITDGNLKVANGHGIDFSSTANSAGTMGSELFSFYEEGSWNPTFTTNSGSAASYSSATGRYTKIGRTVFIHCSITNISTNGTTGTSQMRVNGLPFTCEEMSGHGALVMDNITLQGGRTQLTAVVSTSEYVALTQSGSALGDTPTDHNNINSGVSDLHFSAMYISSQ